MAERFGALEGDLFSSSLVAHDHPIIQRIQRPLLASKGTKHIHAQICTHRTAYTCTDIYTQNSTCMHRYIHTEQHIH